MDNTLPKQKRYDFDTYEECSYERNTLGSRSWDSVLNFSSKPQREKKSLSAPDKTSLLSLGKGIKKADGLDYKKGDRVMHIKYGSGTVKDIVDDVKDYKVTVDFDNAGVKIMYAMFAKLKKV